MTRDAKMESIAICAMGGNNCSTTLVSITRKSVWKVGAKRASVPIITHKNKEDIFRKWLKTVASGFSPGTESPTASSNSSQPKKPSFPSTSSQPKVLSIWAKTKT